MAFVSRLVVFHFRERTPNFFHLSLNSPLADTTTSPTFSAQTRGTLSLSFLLTLHVCFTSSGCVSAVRGSKKAAN